MRLAPLPVDDGGRRGAPSTASTHRSASRIHARGGPRGHERDAVVHGAGHAVAIAELRGPGGTVAKATFDAARVADEGAALRSAVGGRAACCRRRRCSSERQQRGGAAIGAAGRRRRRVPRRATRVDARGVCVRASAADRDRAADAAAASGRRIHPPTPPRGARANGRPMQAERALPVSKGVGGARRAPSRRAAKARFLRQLRWTAQRDSRVAAMETQLALGVAAARQNAVTERSKSR